MYIPTELMANILANTTIIEAQFIKHEMVHFKNRQYISEDDRFKLRILQRYLQKVKVGDKFHYAFNPKYFYWK